MSDVEVMDYFEQRGRGEEVEVEWVVSCLFAQQELKLFLSKEQAVLTLFAKLLHVLHVYVFVTSFFRPHFGDLVVDHLYLLRNVDMQFFLFAANVRFANKRLKF